MITLMIIFKSPNNPETHFTTLIGYFIIFKAPHNSITHVFESKFLLKFYVFQKGSGLILLVNKSKLLFLSDLNET